MTMIDEDFLSAALRGAADAVDVDDGAARRILREARSSPGEDRRIRTRFGQHRSLPLLVGAAALLVVGAISWPLLRSERGVHSTSAVHGLPARVLYPPTAQGGLVVTGSGVSFGAQIPRGSSKTMTSTAGASAVGGPRIESTGSVELRVAAGRVASTLTALGQVAQRDGGSTVSTQAQMNNRASGHFASGTIVLQVPERSFAKLVDQVQRLGRTLAVSTTSTDVTGQYVDLSARISAAEATRTQYLAIMARATSIGAVLAVQQRLDSIQSQIEQLQGQLHLLDHETTDGALTVVVSTSVAGPPVAHHSSGPAKAFHDAVSGFVTGVEWMIRLSGPVLFAVLLLGVFFLVGKWIWRRRHLGDPS